MPLQLNAATSGSTTLVPTDTITATLTLPASTGTLLSTANPQSGGVIQVVNATTTTTAQTSSSSYQTSSFSCSITPKFSTSKILVIVSWQIVNNTASNICYATIYRNATNLGSGTQSALSENSNQVSSGYAWVPLHISYLDSPATTSSTTYTIYYKASPGGYASVGDTNCTGSIILMEIAQ